MRKIICVTTMLMLLGLASHARAEFLTVTDAAVNPEAVSPEGTVTLSCRVAHSVGPAYVEIVAASVKCEGWNWSYPVLYDDGTNGDETAGDGFFSLQIKAPDVPGQASIVFTAVDVDRQEVESEPVFLMVQ